VLCKVVRGSACLPQGRPGSNVGLSPLGRMDSSLSYSDEKKRYKNTPPKRSHIIIQKSRENAKEYLTLKLGFMRKNIVENEMLAKVHILN
jgi:hypothetical protein